MNNRNVTILFFFGLFGLIAIDLKFDVPYYFYIIILSCYLLVNTWGTLFVSSQFFLPTKCKGEKAGGIALTFDDGPVPEKTDRILEILRLSNVKATFFCIGKNVKAHTELTKRIHTEGHLLGNHSFFHGALFDLQSSNRMMKELAETNRAIQDATGILPRFFRPPYGITNPMLALAVKKMNFVTVGWSIRSFDTVARKKKKLFERVIKNLKDGDIILFHDRCEATIEILPDLLIHIKKLGLKIESLDRVLGDKAYE